MAKVVFDHVQKRYGEAPPVVADLSLTIEDQELVVVVGPSGCGKSTALRMIAGLEGITAGSLFIDERRMNDVPPKDRDVAMVFQSYALYPHMTCFENMAFALTLRRLDEREIARRVEAAAKILAIEHLLARRPKELSGGQRQRVAIGRAIVRSPRVFLMDEPLSNLDAKLRATTRVELKRLHRELRSTIVYVTHDQTEAMTLGDRIAVMRSGELLQFDTPEAVYRRPATAFVATFMGSPEMNLFDGELEGGVVSIPGARLRLDVAGAGKILLGVRAEDLSLGAATGDLALEGRVELTETTGSDTFVHVSTHAGKLVCRASGIDAPRAGENVRLVADERAVHVFDRVTGARMT